MRHFVPLLALMFALVPCRPAPGQTAEAAQEQHGNTSIAGVVVNAATGAPLDRADVRISAGGDQSGQVGETLTDANGAFRFGGLPEGRYRLQASRRGYITSGYQGHDGFSTAIVTGPQLDTTHLRFPLTPWGAIDGTISDDNGDPVADAEVRLFRQDEQRGEGRIMEAGRQQSDDRGTFEFASLRPGSYFISVAATPWYAFRPAAQVDNRGNSLPDDQQPTSPLDVAYPLTFYPNATDSAGATPIPVRGGDRLQINFSLHAVPAVHLQVRAPLGNSQIGNQIPELSQDAFGTPEYGGSALRSSRFRENTATWDFSVAPGRYQLHRGRDIGSDSETEVDITSSSSINAPPPASPVDISGKVAMASGGPLPHDAMVAARRMNGEFLERTVGIQSDGSFTLHNVPPGVYDVTVRGASGALMVAQMAASGAEVHGNRVTVGSDSVLLAATLARGSATIDGFVQRGSQGFGGAMVELVPDDPNAPVELIRRDQSNSDGSFTLRRVVPGNYMLVAIDDGWTLEWAKRDAMIAYLNRGVKVQVGDDEKLQLPNPVPVQER